MAANLSNCFRLRTGIVSAMVDYPIGDLIAERVRQMGVTPFYKYFKHNGVNGPNMATIYSDRGYGVRAPVVFYNRANEAAAQLKPGDFDWNAIFAGGVRWFHSGGIFAALSETTGELIIEAMKAAKAAGAVTSFDLNYRAKLWNIWGGQERAQSVIRRIVENVDVLVGNEEDLQLGLGHPRSRSRRQIQTGPEHLLRDDRQGGGKVPASQDRCHHPARSPLDQPSQLGRGGLDRWQDLYLAHLRTGCLRSGRRRGWICIRLFLRPADRRTGTGSCQPGLGAWCAADHLPRRYHHGHRWNRCRLLPKAVRQEFNGNPL